MPVPSAITDLSTTPASNSPAGSESPATTDDYFRSHAAFIAQLRAVIGGATDASIPTSWPAALDLVTQSRNSGTTGGTSTAYTLTPATAIASYSAGMTFWVRFHVASGASPTLMISGLASPPALVRQNASGAFVAIGAGDIPLNHASRVTLLSASQALVEDMPPAAAPADLLNSIRIDVASAATVDLTAAAPNTRNINITGTNAISAFTVAAGQVYFVRFAGALTLTNNASIVTQSGASITTTAGDTCIIRATAANVVEVLSYKTWAMPKSECTAWVNFNGTGTVAILDSYNVSSITDNGVGEYTINFATAMANTNYMLAGGGLDNDYGDLTVGRPAGGLKTTTAIRIKTVSGAYAIDSSDVGIVFFGGKQ